MPLTSIISKSHTFTVLSSLADTTVLQSGEKATDVTPHLKNDQIEGDDLRECPFRVLLTSIDSTSHRFNELREQPDATVLPSGEKATDNTEFECPVKVPLIFIVSASHTFTVASKLPDTIVLPSGEKATDITA